MSREGAGQLVGRYPDGFVDTRYAVLGEPVVFALAEDQANGRSVVWVTEQVVYHVAVKVQLACILRPESPLLQIDDDERPQPQVVEQKVDIVVVPIDLQMELSPDERKAYAQRQQEFLDVVH